MDIEGLAEPNEAIGEQKALQMALAFLVLKTMCHDMVPLKADLARIRSEKINKKTDCSLHQSSEYLDASQAVPRDPGISVIVAIGRQTRKPAELHRECRHPVLNPRISFLFLSHERVVEDLVKATSPIYLSIYALHVYAQCRCRGIS